MRIVHVIDYFQPKLGYQETFLAREHAKSGQDVYVVASDRYNPIAYSGDEAKKSVVGSRKVGAGFFVEEGIKVWRLKALFEIPHVIWMQGLESKIRELRPDIVIVHNIVTFSALRIAWSKKKLGSFKLLYDDHMTPDNSLSKMRILYPWFKWLFSPLIQKAADGLVAILPETRVFMHEKYGIPPERVVIIPLGADDELFRFDAVARQRVRKELGISEDEVVFVYTGKIIPRKRLHLLIEAASSLGADHSNVRVVLVGSGSQSYIEELKKDVKAKNMEDKFVWLEAVSNSRLPEIYSAADVAVWPYGPSISMREAMACGLPIIIGEDAKVAELVDYNNGLLYREGDVLHLSQQMEKLLDPQLRQEMGRNSRRLVADRFSWGMIARQYIEQVAGQPR